MNMLLPPDNPEPQLLLGETSSTRFSTTAQRVPFILRLPVLDLVSAVRHLALEEIYDLQGAKNLS
jgi:hypothetical protein